MRAALAYAPRPGPLGAARPAIAATYLGALAAVVFTFTNPLVLAAAAAATYLAARGSRATGALRQPLRWGLSLGLLVVVVNALVSQRGDTVLARGPELPVVGQIDVTLEAIAEGGVLALRILVALLVFALWSACVDPDRVLRAVRPLAVRSALTATLITRLVPLAAADAARLGEAASLRGPAAAPVGRGVLARRLVAGSLDRSVDVAATLELRGYGLPGTPSRERVPAGRGEIPLLLAGVATVAVAIVAKLAGVADFEAYPSVSIDAGAGTIALCAAIVLLAWLPFATERAARAIHRRRLRARPIGGPARA